MIWIWPWLNVFSSVASRTAEAAQHFTSSWDKRSSCSATLNSNCLTAADEVSQKSEILNLLHNQQTHHLLVLDTLPKWANLNDEQWWGTTPLRWWTCERWNCKATFAALRSADSCSRGGGNAATWKSVPALHSLLRWSLQVLLNHSNDVNTLLLFAPTVWPPWQCFKELPGPFT